MTALLGTLLLTVSSLGISVVIARAALTGALRAASRLDQSRPVNGSNFPPKRADAA
jgi:hypothetical protein